jgi:hypothetical protein
VKKRTVSRLDLTVCDRLQVKEGLTVAYNSRILLQLLASAVKGVEAERFCRGTPGKADNQPARRGAGGMVEN